MNGSHAFRLCSFLADRHRFARACACFFVPGQERDGRCDLRRPETLGKASQTAGETLCLRSRRKGA